MATAGCASDPDQPQRARVASEFYRQRRRQVRKRLPPATQTDHLWRGGGAVNSSKGPQAHATLR